MSTLRIRRMTPWHPWTIFTRDNTCDPPTPSEKRRLRPISAYNVLAVRASEKIQLSRLGSRQRAFQRAIDDF